MWDHSPLNSLSTDPLSEAMEALVIRSWVPGAFHLTVPWGLRASGDMGWCYLVRTGSCVLQMEHTNKTIALERGDLAVVPQQQPHTLSDSPDSRKDSLGGLLWPAHFERLEPLNHGGGGPQTTLSCICVSVDGLLQRSVLSFLSDLLIVRAEAGRPPAYVEYIFRLVTQEASSAQPCSAAIINRLVRILLIRSIYHAVSRLPGREECWLRALLDPSIGEALAVMHRQPGEQWTVASLADRVAMSRTAFATRFTKLLGRSPLEYLTEWRMQRASVLLLRSDLGLKEIADQVGYDSAASFSKAFTRWSGSAPSAYREHIRLAASRSWAPPKLV